jgi:hypothetical protein
MTLPATTGDIDNTIDIALEVNNMEEYPNFARRLCAMLMERK